MKEVGKSRGVRGRKRGSQKEKPKVPTEDG